LLCVPVRRGAMTTMHFGPWARVACARCGCEFGVTRSDPADIDDALKIRACNAEVAAMRWAERSDRESGDWSIVHGGDLKTACVVLEERRLTEEPTLYHVWGESVPKYHATRKE